MTTVHHRLSGWSFDIAPMLDRGWGYDPYVQNLIGRIRAGRPARECLFDFNNLFLSSGRDSDQQRVALKKREISAEEMAAYKVEEQKRKDARDALYAEQRAKAKADREAREAERQREYEAWELRREELVLKAREQQMEWEAPRLEPTAKAGSWRMSGSQVSVMVGLIASNDTRIMVSFNGSSFVVEKSAIRRVKERVWTGSAYLTELTVEPDVAEAMGVELRAADARP